MNYIQDLIQRIMKSSKYDGVKITELAHWGSISIDNNTLKKIDDYVNTGQYESILSIQKNTDNELIAALIFVKDKNSSCFLVIDIETIELWKDNLIYRVVRIPSEQYNIRTNTLPNNNKYIEALDL